MKEVVHYRAFRENHASHAVPESTFSPSIIVPVTVVALSGGDFGAAGIACWSLAVGDIGVAAVEWGRYPK